MVFQQAISKDPVSRRWPLLVRVMLGRLVLLVALLAGVGALLVRQAVGYLGFCAVIGMAFVVTILYALWLRHEDTVRRSAPNQFMLDVLVITGLVHFTGGIQSDLSLLYPLVILAAGIAVSGRLALRVTLFAVFVYATLVVLEIGGVLGVPGRRGPPLAPETVAQVLMVRTLIFVFFAAGSSFMADRIFHQDRQLERLATIGQALFSNVTVPLIGVQPDGRIMLVNQAASALLGSSPDQLRERPVADLFAGDVPSLGPSPAGADGVLGEAVPPVWWYLRRADGTAFPATLEVSRARFPAAVTDSLMGSGEVELAVVAFRDMTGVLQSREQIRLKAAAGMLTEVAHEVGNPLAAIKCAGEVLNRAMAARSREEERKISPADWRVIASMCDVISEETARLDQKVKDYLDWADGDPQRLLELTAEAETWARKLPPATGDRSHGTGPASR